MTRAAPGGPSGAARPGRRLLPLGDLQARRKSGLLRSWRGGHGGKAGRRTYLTPLETL
ncbi:hypothetical protein GCM10020216_061300 [Nonomuraea helvata]